MSIYLKLSITSIVFLFSIYFLAFPTTPYAKWLTKKCNDDYFTALLYSIGIGISPLIITGLVYLWREL